MATWTSVEGLPPNYREMVTRNGLKRSINVVLRQEKYVATPMTNRPFVVPQAQAKRLAMPQFTLRGCGVRIAWAYIATRLLTRSSAVSGFSAGITKEIPSGDGSFQCKAKVSLSGSAGTWIVRSHSSIRGQNRPSIALRSFRRRGRTRRSLLQIDQSRATPVSPVRLKISQSAGSGKNSL